MYSQCLKSICGNTLKLQDHVEIIVLDMFVVFGIDDRRVAFTSILAFSLL
jgi:hypothetical protein